MLLPTLPDNRFFEPRQKFFKHMETFKDNIVVDVGAGCGHVAAELEDKGFKVIAIDIHPREGTVYPVYMLDAETFNYPAGCVALIARPCHGYFVERAIQRALEAAKCVLYVGKKRNVPIDIEYLPYKMEIIGTRVGKEDEVMIRIGENDARNE